ncbi:hypothetical protein B9K06_26065, partial [Bacillus sp. OG2]
MNESYELYKTERNSELAALNKRFESIQAELKNTEEKSLENITILNQLKDEKEAKISELLDELKTFKGLVKSTEDEKLSLEKDITFLKYKMESEVAELNLLLTNER